MKNFKFAALLAPTVFLGIPLCGDPSGAFAADSRTNGITMPRNYHFTGFSKERAKEGTLKKTPWGDNTAVLIWRGNNHCQNRAIIVQTVTPNALRGTLATVKAVDRNELRGAFFLVP